MTKQLRLKYIITNLCGKTWITTDTKEAERASHNGCYVKAHGKIL